jgi:hypothetical protein
LNRGLTQIRVKKFQGLVSVFDPSTLESRSERNKEEEAIAMARSAGKDAQALFHSLRSAYAATPTTLKVSLSLSLPLSPPSQTHTFREYFRRESVIRAKIDRFLHILIIV